jgi:ankyrin repeat protein
MFDQSVLLSAVAKGNAVVVRALLAQGCDVNVIFDGAEGHGPLHVAARSGNVDVCVALLAAGAPLSAPATNGETPLHLAVGNCFPEVCAVLLNHGANPNARRAQAITPLMDAVGYDAVNTAMCALLIEHGAALDAVDLLGHTALNSAIAMGCMAVARLLLERGADPNLAAGPELHAPLRSALYAIVGSDPFKTLDEEVRERVHLLLDHGADPSYTPANCPADFLSPFQSAFVTRRREYVDLFCSRVFVDLDGRTVNGRTLDDLCGGDGAAREWLQALRVEQAIRLAIAESADDACAEGGKRSTIEILPL